MSGIAAIIRFDGGAVEPGAIEKMTAAMDYRGPDGIRHWSNGPVALGHCMLRTTAESLEEVQPLANEDESLVLVMDGWLSNWEELRSDLLTRGATLRTRSDAELVLRAYEQWGEDCPRRIDGEFAFVVWDARRRQAYCARDHAGLRPLHYHWNGSRLTIASDLKGVLADCRVPRRLNHGMVAEFISARWFDQGQTMWEDVLRLPAAHWGRFGCEGLRTGRYWSPPLEVSLTYRCEEDYVAHYRELLTDCVRRASRSHLPVAYEVSGGLDSSAVFAIAHRLLGESKLPAPAVEGYTLLFEQKNSELDELEFVHAVRDHLQHPIHEVPAFMPDLAWFEARGREDMDLPPYPNGAMQIGLFEAVAAAGSRVIVSGQGGDEWLDGSQWYYTEQLRGRQWSALARTLREDIRDAGLRKTAGWFLRFGLGQLLPEPILTLRRSVVDRIRRAERDYEYFLSPQMKELVRQRSAQCDDSQYLAISNKARQSMARTLGDAYNNLNRGRTAVLAARSGYEPRSPMHARAYIEFAFATPERIRRHGDVRKYVHRRALAGALPDTVVHRMTKAEFSMTFAPPIRAAQAMMASEDERLDCWVTRSGLRELYRQYDSSPGWPMWQLWGIFGCLNLLRGAQA